MLQVERRRTEGTKRDNEQRLSISNLAYQDEEDWQWGAHVLVVYCAEASEKPPYPPLRRTHVSSITRYITSGLCPNAVTVVPILLVRARLLSIM